LERRDLRRAVDHVRRRRHGADDHHRTHVAGKGAKTGADVTRGGQLALAISTSSGEFRYMPDMVSTQHRWS
jgi:hypothetical protein